MKTYDEAKKQNFMMKAAVMWTITNFPGLGMISGWSTHGKLSCPVCVGDIQGIQLKIYKKNKDFLVQIIVFYTKMIPMYSKF